MQALATPRLDLEPLTQAHTEVLVKEFLDPGLWTYLQHLRPAGPDEVRARIARWLAPPPPELPDALAFENWVAFERATRVAVGTFQATLVRDGSATIGWIVFSAYQRRGYAVEAMTAVCAYICKFHAIRRIVADMDRRNVASAAVAKKLGMVERAAPNDADRCFELRIVS